MEGFINHYVTLGCRLDDGNTGLFPQAKVYDKDGTLITTKNLTHLSDGNYTDVTWTPTLSGYYTVNYTIFTDGARTFQSYDYNQNVESLFITEYLALSSQVLGISSQVLGAGIGLTADGVWTYGTRTLTEGTRDTSIDGISSQLSTVSSNVSWISSQIPWVSSQLTGLSSQIQGVGFLSLIEKINWISSQTLGLSSQIFNISSNLPLGQWHGEGTWGGGTADLSTITPELDYISSQLNWISGMHIGLSSQIYGISSMIYNTPPGAGATAAQVWAYGSRALTETTVTDYISSQVNYISSQLTMISSQLEPYGGGGGGRSYVSYTSKQGPWRYAEKEKIIQDVKDILTAIDGLEKKTENFHKEEVEKLLNSEQTILTSISASLTHLGKLKKSIEESDIKDVKLLSSVDASINTLNVYKNDVESKFKELESCLGDILKLLGTVTPMDRLAELEEEEVNEK
jgi:hypothetical protein